MIRKQMEQNILGSIFLIANKLQAEGDKIIPELTLKQLFLLVMLFKLKDSEPSLNNLADIMGVSRQNIKKMTQILEEKEFVKIEKSTIDNRALNIKPTIKAYQIFQQNKPAIGEFLDFTFAEISDNELEIVFKVLNKTFKNLKVEVKDAD